MDKVQQPHEPLDLDEEEFHRDIKEMNVKEGEPITQILKYIPSCKSTTKVPKDPNNTKFMISTPLLPEKVVFDGAMLGRIPSLKLEDWDLGDHAKFP